MRPEDKRSYYNVAGVECDIIIDELDLNFSEGSALKYLYRCNIVNPKGTYLEDLKKARYYLNKIVEANLDKRNKSNIGDYYLAQLDFTVWNSNLSEAIEDIIASVGIPQADYLGSIKSALEHVLDEINRH